jgi:hypothetical protein
MKRLMMTSVIMLIAAVTYSQSAPPAPNLYWSMTVKVKMDKKLEWEKKMVVYVKTHMPQLKYRVWEVLSGENTGAYVIVMGPMSYKDMDVPLVSPKGEALMKADGQGLDALCESSQVMYMRRQDASISTLKADRKLKYLLATSVEIDPGTWDVINDFAKKIKEAREKGGSKMDIDYFRPNNSGNTNAFATVRYAEKMEEFDLQENLPEMFDKVHGANAWYIGSGKRNEVVKSSRAELRVLRTDLSAL